MRGKVKGAWVLALILGLLSLLTAGFPALAAPERRTTFSGFAEIQGPISLTASVTPPVTSPREAVTVELTLTNDLDSAQTPEVILGVPVALSHAQSRYPAGTTFDVQTNSLRWQPVVDPEGGVETLSLTYNVAVADLTRPEQELSLQLRYGETEAATSVVFWAGLPPTAAMTVEPRVAAVGQPIQLQAQPQGPGPFITTWDLGDGRELTTRDPTVVFSAPGVYEITLKVANPLAAATAISEVTIVAEPTAAFTVDDERPEVGQEVQFTNQSGGQQPLNYIWDFGDGQTSEEPNPAHRFSEPGTYEVLLTVESEHGEAETTLSLTVGSAPVADVVVPGQLVTGQSFEARAFGDDSVAEFQWDMGDGTSYPGDVVTHTYRRTGEFVVTLTAANEYGETQVSRSVQVDAGTFTTFVPIAIRAGDTMTPTTPSGSTITDTATLTPGAATITQTATVTPGGAGAEMPGGQPPPVTLPPQTPLPQDASQAERLLWYINEARRMHGLQPLTYNYELSIAAQQHTADMVANPDIMHVGSDGSRPAERQSSHGYGGGYGGEAVAWGWESPIPVVEFWVNSPPHRVLILSPDAVEVGVGHVADGTAPNIWYWTAEFGVGAGQAPPPQ